MNWMGCVEAAIGHHACKAQESAARAIFLLTAGLVRRWLLVLLNLAGILRMRAAVVRMLSCVMAIILRLGNRDSVMIALEARKGTRTA